MVTIELLNYLELSRRDANYFHTETNLMANPLAQDIINPTSRIHVLAY